VDGLSGPMPATMINPRLPSLLNSKMFKKISWVTSSAKAGCFSMSMAREYTGVWYRVHKASRASLSTWEPR